MKFNSYSQPMVEARRAARAVILAAARAELAKAGITDETVVSHRGDLYSNLRIGWLHMGEEHNLETALYGTKVWSGVRQEERVLWDDFEVVAP